MIRTIELTPSFQSYASPSGGGFRFRADVTRAENVEPEIFLYTVAPPTPGTGALPCKFQKICSPADVAAYPSLSAVAAMSSGSVIWMRAPYIDLLFVTRAEAEDTWAIVQSDVKSLLRAYESQDALDQLAPVTFTAGQA